MLTSAVTTDTAAVELLSELIRIPSMAPGVEQGVGDGAVAAAVEAFGRANQAAVERQPVLPGRDNVLLSTRAEPGAAVLLIEAHMDTVALGPMTNGLKPWVDDRGCLHGRGACDTKGSLAAALLALQWAVQHPLPHCRLTVCAAVDEEVGGAGARTMAGADRRIDGVIVGEPTHLELVRAHRGGAAWWLSTVGTAGHTSQPELGDNAIYRMADVLQVLREEYPRVLAAKRHPLTGPSTFAVGRIEAGLSGSLNMIPARCTLYVERRPNPGETVDSLIDEFEGLMDIVRRRSPGIRLDYAHPKGPFGALDTPESSPLVQAVRRGCVAALGAARITGMPYGSDASTFAARGVPAVLFGPGDIRYAHSADELVPVAELVAAAQVYVEAWLAFAEGAPNKPPDS